MAVRTSTFVRNSFVPLFSMMVFGASQHVLAQDSFLIDAGPCLALTSPVERLACFEDQVRAAESLQTVAPALVREPVASRPEAAAPALAPAPAAVGQAGPAQESVAARRSPVTEFGLREKPEEQEKLKEMQAVVASVRQFAPGQQLVSLTNGQVWRQTRAERYALREGQDVRIYATRWGNNFRLSARDLGGFIQVERVE